MENKTVPAGRFWPVLYAYRTCVLLGGGHDGLGGCRRGATQGLYKTAKPGQPVQAALKQA